MVNHTHHTNVITVLSVFIVVSSAFMFQMSSPTGNVVSEYIPNSCANSCGGKSLTGNCFCDGTSLTTTGDYCSDVVLYCDVEEVCDDDDYLCQRAFNELPYKIPERYE